MGGFYTERKISNNILAKSEIIMAKKTNVFGFCPWEPRLCVRSVLLLQLSAAVQYTQQTALLSRSQWLNCLASCGSETDFGNVSICFRKPLCRFTTSKKFHFNKIGNNKTCLFIKDLQCHLDGRLSLKCLSWESLTYVLSPALGIVILESGSFQRSSVNSPTCGSWTLKTSTLLMSHRK